MNADELLKIRIEVKKQVYINVVSFLMKNKFNREEAFNTTVEEAESIANGAANNFEPMPD